MDGWRRNFYGEIIIRERLDGQTSAGEWETFNLNIYTLNNLFTILGDAASKSAVQIITDALEDVNSKVVNTNNTSGVSYIANRFSIDIY